MFSSQVDGDPGDAVEQEEKEQPQQQTEQPCIRILIELPKRYESVILLCITVNIFDSQY